MFRSIFVAQLKETNRIFPLTPDQIHHSIPLEKETEAYNSLQIPLNMDETNLTTTKPRRKASKRNPLTDLTNTIPSCLPSSQSSSSSIKTQIKSSLPSDLKSLPNNPNTRLKHTSKLTATESTKNINNINDKKKENEKCPSDKANPSSKPSPPSKTPSVSGNFDGSRLFLGFGWVI